MAGEFVFSVVIAVAIGLVVGTLNLRVRARIAEPTINTAISFAVPFVAFLPAEHLAPPGWSRPSRPAWSPVTAHRDYLRPRRTGSARRLNWRTIELCSRAPSS